MADPRFYDNCGPFTLADICAKTGAALPEGADGGLMVDDVASLSGAGATHLSFFSGSTKDAGSLASSQAGFVFVPANPAKPAPLRDGAIALSCRSVQHAFAAAASLFYPESNFTSWPQQTSIDRTAEIGEDVMLAPGVVIGPGAEIGDGTRIGPNTVIGRGVAVGKNCEIASNVSIAHAYIGDAVVIFPGVQIGAPGFGFASGAAGHVKIPQLGRVIVQDRVEIGACTTIDRGALGDTVVGEGTKIDNLVQIGHNTRVGRHCVIVAQVGISGSCEIGDYVVLGGQVGIGDHSRIGNGARLAARTAMASGQDLPGGQDYGGVPAKPVKEWMREIYTLAKLTKKPKRDDNG
jgi:UDP-3-O-[3-hydroxymyristoyl] glucosamine N-acyltransferase